MKAQWMFCFGKVFKTERSWKSSPDCSGILFCGAERNKKDIAESGTGVLQGSMVPLQKISAELNRFIQLIKELTITQKTFTQKSVISAAGRDIRKSKC